MQLGAEAVACLAVMVEGLALQSVDGGPGFGQGDGAFPGGVEQGINLQGEVPVGIGGHLACQQCQGGQSRRQVWRMPADRAEGG